MSTPIEAAAELKVVAAQTKVSKLEAHLAAAREALAEARAELVAARSAGASAELEHSGEVTYAHAELAEGFGEAGQIG